MQEAYLRFAEVVDGERPDRILQPVGYLYRIVRNLALDWARHLAHESVPAAPALLERIASPAPSPEQAALDRGRLRIVVDALAQLPPRTRRAFELHRLQDKTFPVIAAQLGTSVGLAHRLVKDALTHCAARFVAFPGTPFSSSHHYMVAMHGAAPLTARLITPVLVDTETATLTAMRALPWYVTALLISQPLHFGDYGELPLKILWAALDLVTIIVLGSGLYLWLARRRTAFEAEIAELERAETAEVGAAQ